jgi:hypothetical protein
MKYARGRRCEEWDLPIRGVLSDVGIVIVMRTVRYLKISQILEDKSGAMVMSQRGCLGAVHKGCGCQSYSVVKWTTRYRPINCVVQFLKGDGTKCRKIV